MSIITIRLKEAAGHTLVYGLGSVLQAALGYILIPLYTRYYTTDVYGVFALLTLVGTFAGSLFNLGLASALSRSYFDYEGDVRRRVVGTTVISAMVTGTIQVCFGTLLAKTVSLWLFGTPEYAPHIVVVVATSAAADLSRVGLRLLQLERRSFVVVLANLMSLIVTTILIAYLLVWRGMGVMAPVLGMFLGRLAYLSALAVACRGYYTMAFIGSELGRQVRYGVPIMVSSLAYVVLDWVDRVLIKGYGTLADVGIYSLGYKIGISIHILFIIPFAQIWDPMRMEYRETEYITSLHTVMVTYYAVIGLSLTTLISVFSPEIMDVIASRPEYRVAFYVVPPVMLGHVFYGSINLLDSGIAFARKTYMTTVVLWVFVGVNLGLNFILIPRFGYLAAAYTTLATYVLVAAVVYRLAGRYFRIPIQRRVTKVVVLTVIAIAMGFAMTGLPAGAATVLGIKAFVVAAYLGLVYAMVLDGGERNALVREVRGLMGGRP